MACSAAKFGCVSAQSGIVGSFVMPHGKKLMHAAVAGSVGIKLESNLSNGAELLLEGRSDILNAETTRNQPEQGIFRPQRRVLTRIGDEKSPRTPQCRLSMAQEALVRIVPGAKAVRIRVELREQRIKLAQADNRTAIGHVGACVACGFQLPGAEDAFHERDLFVDLNRGPGPRVGAD
ncbi:MAG TPA: hypothetical protein VIH87_06420 [Methylocella sp.]